MFVNSYFQLFLLEGCQLFSAIFTGGFQLFSAIFTGGFSAIFSYFYRSHQRIIIDSIHVCLGTNASNFVQ
jgi:hypothetical protein